MTPPEIAVRARKSPWIETVSDLSMEHSPKSGLVRARGLKLSGSLEDFEFAVRARKSPWIETLANAFNIEDPSQGS